MIIDEKKLAATGCMITRPVFFWPVTVCTRSCNLRSISCLDAIQYIVGLEIILVHGFVTLVTAVAYHFCLQHSRNHIQVLFLGPVETIYTLALSSKTWRNWFHLHVLPVLPSNSDGSWD